MKKSNAFIASILLTLISVSACSRSSNSTASDYLVTHTSTHEVRVGTGRIIVAEFEVCSKSQAKCAQTALIYDKGMNIIKQLSSKNSSEINFDSVSLESLNVARKESSVSNLISQINVKEKANTIRRMNARNLKICQSVYGLNRMKDLNDESREVLYFHYANTKIENSHLMFKLESGSGALSIQETKHSLPVDDSSSLNLVSNASDDRGELLQDNLYIMFTDHYNRCQMLYAKGNLNYPMNGNFDDEASRVLNLENQGNEKYPYSGVQGVSEPKTHPITYLDSLW